LNAIILAAGEGKRLGHLTKNKPKCMVNLFGKTMLEWQVSVFKKCGISDITVVTGYKAEMIDLPNLEFFHNKNFETTNMVESLFCALKKLNESTIVSYGDIIFGKNVLNSLIESENNFSVVVDKQWKKYWEMRFDNPLSDAESLKIDHDGNITSIGQKVKEIDDIEGQYIGLMKFQNDGLTTIKEFYQKIKNQSKNNPNPINPDIAFKQSYMTDFLQGLINSGHKLKAIEIENGWLELDSINDYNKYTKFFSKKTISEFVDLDD